MDKDLRCLYDLYNIHKNIFLLNFNVKDNRQPYFNDNEPRKLPKNMVLHPSVKWFSSKPKNSIDNYKYLEE